MDSLIRSPWFVLVATACVIGEAYWRIRIARRGYDVDAALTTLTIALGNVVSALLHAGVLASIFATIAALAPLHWHMRDWALWPLAFVLVEFVYYWTHRWSHEVRWLWATHAVHHSSTELTLLSATRLGWTNLFSGAWLLLLPLLLVGLDPTTLVTLLALNLHYQFLLHTEAFGRWGWLEWVLNTPTHHRVHHASNPAYLDCNYGGVLIVFDRLFGTFVEAHAGEVIRYGLVHADTSYDPLVIAFGEWRRLFRDMRHASSPARALRIALGRP